MILKDKKFRESPTGTVFTEKPTLWHCHNSRSVRPLWTLSELDIDYDLVVMQFPPRYTEPNYKKMNVLGTVPYFIDGTVHMSESTAICQYLVNKYQNNRLNILPEHPEYGDFLNWLYMSDSTLVFPQTIALRYSKLEPLERQSKQVADDYKAWFLARLKKLNQHLENNIFLCDNRFTIADIAIGYALYLGQVLGWQTEYPAIVTDYLLRLQQRPKFLNVINIGSSKQSF